MAISQPSLLVSSSRNYWQSICPWI